MNKCPACGYKIDNSYNTSAEISKLMKKRNSKTRKYLNKIASEVTQSIPSESRLSYFQFLFGIKDIDDNIVSWAIEQYYRSRHYLDGKGFAYLRSIAQNRNKNIDKLRKNERNRLGSVPPVYKGED